MEAASQKMPQMQSIKEKQKFNPKCFFPHFVCSFTGAPLSLTLSLSKCVCVCMCVCVCVCVCECE